MVKEYRRPGFRAVTGLQRAGSAAFLEFLKRAFDAREGEIDWNADPAIGHGEILIGDSLIEVSEARPQWPAGRVRSTCTCRTPTPCYASGGCGGGGGGHQARQMRPTATVRRPSAMPAGNNWFIATRLEGPPVPDGLSLHHAVRDHAGADAVMALAGRRSAPTERIRVPAADGKVMHAEMQIEDSVVEFSDGSARWPPRPCNLHLYVPDVDRPIGGRSRRSDVTLRADGSAVRGSRSAA